MERGKPIMQKWERGKRDERSAINREEKLLESRAESWPDSY